MTKTTAEIRAKFYEEILKHGLRPMVLANRRQDLVWLSRDLGLGALGVREYSQSPLILRVTVGAARLKHKEETIRRKTGWPIADSCSWRSLELSLLPSQLVEFGEWFAHYIEYLEDTENVAMLPPPCRCDVYGTTDIYEAAYVWTSDATKEYDRRK